MISVQEAEQIILSLPFSPVEEIVPINRALGRVLASDICSDTDLPPFDRVMMDGIAIRFIDWDNGQRSFPIQSMQQAGEAAKVLEVGMAIEVMTGAMCPIGADCIIPYEEIELEDEASILSETVKLGQHIHKAGSDKKRGDVLIKIGTKLNAAHLMIAASAGFPKIVVWSLPRIHIFSTGDELVEIDEIPLEYQIRRSNVYGLKYLLEQEGFDSSESHLADDKDIIRSKLKDSLRDCDVILLSGGVSKGKFDFIPEILQELGVTKHFHGIAQKPGKPFWFGTMPGKFIFAFPGNPVSTMMCATRYLIPWIHLSYGQKLKNRIAILTKPFERKGNNTFFLQIGLEQGVDGILYASPIPGAGSGDFANLADIDGFAEVSPERDLVAAGTPLPVYCFDYRGCKFAT